MINKGLSEKDFIQTVKYVFESGWRKFKLYFMIGLPSETEEDLKGIIDLATKTIDLGLSIIPSKERGQLRVVLNISSFVPKPFTPFQWCSQERADEVLRKKEFLREKLKSRFINFKWHDPFQCLVEGVFSRGDRRISLALYKAWEKGAILDGWSDYFSFSLWEEAFKESNISPSFYLYRNRLKDELFPWDIIDIGLKKDFLWSEFEKSFRGESTPDCRTKCVDCGICFPQGLKNILVSESKKQ